MKKLFNTSQLIENNTAFLDSIVKNKKSKKQIDKMLKIASEEQLLCFVEICLNLLKGRLPFHKNRISTLQKHANILRKISRSRNAHSTRYLLQQGNGITASLLAGLIVPIIANKILN